MFIHFIVSRFKDGTQVTKAALRKMERLVGQIYIGRREGSSKSHLVLHLCQKAVQRGKNSRSYSI